MTFLKHVSGAKDDVHSSITKLEGLIERVHAMEGTLTLKLVLRMSDFLPLALNINT